ncbi:MAG: 50S ribosomal protein L14e [Candidatus Woesearchaeota archaeon]|nr:50S ribosomal protein L14e [Candidatus Woesearchaeota archaeon]
MFEIGRLCVKLAGRDAGLKCVVVDILEGRFVLIDGETRRRKCNILHLEPLSQILKIEKNASHDDVVKVFKELGIEVITTKPKQKTEKPKKLRGKEKAAAKEGKKPAKKEAKKPKAEKKVKEMVIEEAKPKAKKEEKTKE